MKNKKKINGFQIVIYFCVVVILLSCIRPAYNAISKDAFYWYTTYQGSSIPQLKGKADADGVVSKTPKAQVTQQKEQWGTPLEITADEWVKYSCFAETGLRYEGVEYKGYSGTMTYYFDKNGGMAFSEFVISSQEETPEVFEELLNSFNSQELARGIYVDAPDSYEQFDEFFYVWSIPVPGRGYNFLIDFMPGWKMKLSSMKKFDYISLYKNTDEGVVIICRFGFGISPIPIYSNLTDLGYGDIGYPNISYWKENVKGIKEQ